MRGNEMMKHMKFTNVFWYIACIIGVLCGVRAFLITGQGRIDLYQLYHMLFGEIILLALILPVFLGITLSTVEKCQNYSRILQYGSREKWFVETVKELKNICIKYTLLLLVPADTIFIFRSGRAGEWFNGLYGMLSLFLYFGIFFCLSLLVLFIRLLWTADIAGLFGAMLAILLLEILGRTGIFHKALTFEGFINSLYLFSEGDYLWIRHGLCCGAVAVLSLFIYRRIEYVAGAKDVL